MSDLDSTTPRVFLIRHGETEWTKNGRYTGTTELELTPKGVEQVTQTGSQLIGPGRLIDPARIARVWVSPRRRTQQTFRHLFQPPGRHRGTVDERLVTCTEELAEWDYGNYEGLKVAEIRSARKARGLDQRREWVIWEDGCEGGESAQQVTDRLDGLIGRIRELQGPYMDGSKAVDVVLVSHGLVLRAFVKRWLNYSLSTPLPMMLSPGAIGILSYKNHDINEPGFYIGMSLP
ncbi:histidine phosphatase family protein [Aspergillus aculeatinus CBS 121060]|uniref:Phosphoglycerate mutase n=1 Tax=Aspergillus aculeatinus CBS 121060 TaxID=1448322 RepID=A0ACD1GXK8_9EURO|nr:phosphoglycerate mutase [Aspergillus aculeatinus CBS 121060]RAH66011.1 phosphoglycerate mutase [Aspergillus aculeatinus CBS 121060]